MCYETYRNRFADTARSETKRDVRQDQRVKPVGQVTEKPETERKVEKTPELV